MRGYFVSNAPLGFTTVLLNYSVNVLLDPLPSVNFIVSAPLREVLPGPRPTVSIMKDDQVKM